MADARVQELLRELRERYHVDLVPRPDETTLKAMRELASVPPGMALELRPAQGSGLLGALMNEGEPARRARSSLLESWLHAIGTTVGRPRRDLLRCGRVERGGRCSWPAGHPGDCSFQAPARPVPGGVEGML